MSPTEQELRDALARANAIIGQQADEMKALDERLAAAEAELTERKKLDTVFK